ncbi:MAG: hypothetical protein WKG07_25800 [Hymenobacter sp.]
MSPASFAALSAEAMVTKVGDSFQMRIFDNLDEARQWLRQEQRAAKLLA